MKTYQIRRGWFVLNMIKAIFKKPTATITLNSEYLEAVLRRSGTRQEYSFSPILHNILLEMLANKTRQAKEIKGMNIGKVEIKQIWFPGDIIVHVKIPKEVTKKSWPR